jgi:hypothetical protein
MSFQIPHTSEKHEPIRVTPFFLWLFAFIFINIVLLGITSFVDTDLNILFFIFLLLNIYGVASVEVAVDYNRSGKCLFNACM